MLLTLAAAPAWATSTTTPTRRELSPAPELPRVERSLGGEYRLSPLGDGSIITISAGFGLLLELVISTGELRPQAPVDPALLLSIDRDVALSDHIEPGANARSYAGAALIGAYALTDVLLAYLLEREDPLTYLVLYMESASITWAMNDLVKIAVRRPRPRLYQDFRATGMVPDDTDLSLSFYSLHTSLSAALVATGVSLAFARGDEIEPWLVLAGGSALLTMVGVERVRARAHFPTDVLAGALAGAGVGVLVPYLHRVERTLSMSAVPLDGGAALSVRGSF